MNNVNYSTFELNALCPLINHATIGYLELMRIDFASEGILKCVPLVVPQD